MKRRKLLVATFLLFACSNLLNWSTTLWLSQRKEAPQPVVMRMPPPVDPVDELLTKFDRFMSEQAPPVTSICVAHDFYARFTSFLNQPDSDSTVAGTLLNQTDVSPWQLDGELGRRGTLFAEALRADIHNHPYKGIPRCPDVNVLESIRSLYEHDRQSDEGARVLSREFIIQMVRQDLRPYVPYLTKGHEVKRLTALYAGVALTSIFELNEWELKAVGVRSAAARRMLLVRASPQPCNCAEKLDTSPITQQ